MSNEIEKSTEAMELSAQELDEVAGGARRAATAATAELDDFQLSNLEANRDGVSSSNVQRTVDFKAVITEFTETGDKA